MEKTPKVIDVVHLNKNQESTISAKPRWSSKGGIQFNLRVDQLIADVEDVFNKLMHPDAKFEHCVCGDDLSDMEMMSQFNLHREKCRIYNAIRDTRLETFTAIERFRNVRN